MEIDYLFLALMAVAVIAFAWAFAWVILWIEERNDNDEPPLDGNVLLTTQAQLNHLMEQSFQDGMMRQAA